MKMFTIRRNAGQHTLNVHTEEGNQHYELGNLSPVQMGAVREMVVNYWCRKMGHAPLYAEPTLAT